MLNNTDWELKKDLLKYKIHHFDATSEPLITGKDSTMNSLTN